MWVKICGTTTLADAQRAVDAGADAVGFVFAPSKRRVTSEEIARITPSLPMTIEKVGVFHVPDADEITRTIRSAGLTAAQLHFPHDAGIVSTLRASFGASLKLLQVLSCSVEAFDDAALRNELAPVVNDINVWAVLLDASTKGVSGGTGLQFDWQGAATVLDNAWPHRNDREGPKLILAGGLRPENVREAIAQLRPFGVDVVSGVETLPGKKDVERVRSFVEKAKA